MKDTSKDNPSNPITHKDGSQSPITDDSQQLTKDIGTKTYPIDTTQNTNSTVNKETAEPSTSNQATGGNININGLVDDINGFVGDFPSANDSNGQTSGDGVLERFKRGGSNTIA